VFQIYSRSSKSWFSRCQTLALLCLLLSSTPTFPEVVNHCSDGDTCRVKSSDGGQFKVRIFGIDAPESDQPYGKEAQHFINDLLDSKTVNLNCRGESYDRHTCDVFLNGKNVSGILVQQGYAWDYPEFSHGQYTQLQQKAKALKLGLWKDTHPISPYCWRWTGTLTCKNDSYQP
jgi:endonuclease YncB( thermonuclease family)